MIVMFDELKGMLNGSESFLDLDDDAIIDSALETEIFLMALREECESEAEYDRIVTEGATELELYGLIHEADIVTEAKKNIVRLNKQANINMVEKRTAIRMAEKDNSPLYRAYSKGRQLMIASRLKIYEKYGSKAKTVARKVISNSRRRARAMKSDSGKAVSEKMDRASNK